MYDGLIFRQVLPEEQRFLSSCAIHPIKQRSIVSLIDKAKKTPSVERIAVFGSSLTELCRFDSDVDIVVWDKEHKFIPPATDVFDRIYADELNPSWSVYDEVKNKGVIVYER